VHAIADRLLYHETLDFPWGSIPLDIFSLSPSDSANMLSTLTFMTMLPRSNEPKRRLPSFSPNHAAVVVWVRLGGSYILLGSDLQTAADSDSGWGAIVDRSLVAKGRAFVFKVPHHGSVTSHHDSVWTGLLVDKPVAALTPFMMGSVSLPSKDDVSRITALTSSAYVTAIIRQRKHRWRNRIVREFFEASTKSSSDLDVGWGHIRVRRSLRTESEACNVSCFGDATRLAEPGASQE
jgi:hypothetical protein